MRRWQHRAKVGAEVYGRERSEHRHLFKPRRGVPRPCENVGRRDANCSLRAIRRSRCHVLPDNKANWSTWEEFCASARKWYGANRRFQQRILQEATARTQGREEPVRDFITCLLSIMKKVDAPLPLAHQLDRLHRNLRPDLQRMVTRGDFDDIDTLLELSVEAELTLEAVKSYQEPPLPLPPEQSLIPEAAYGSQRNKEKHTPLKVAAFPGTTNPYVAETREKNWIATQISSSPHHRFKDLPLPRRNRKEPNERKKNQQATRLSAILGSCNKIIVFHPVAAQRNRRVAMKEFIVTAAVCLAIGHTIALHVRETGNRVGRRGRHVARIRKDSHRSRRRGLYHSGGAAQRASCSSTGDRA